MSTNRLETFSDGVIAILITIMVLELVPPVGDLVHPGDPPQWSDLGELWPKFIAYVLSFVTLGVYWNNHHHMLVLTERITGGILWANLHLLFWLSLFPFVTSWMGEESFDRVPTSAYGIVALASAIAYYILQSLIVRDQGSDSRLARAIGNDLKGKVSPLFYLSGIGAAFLVEEVALGLYAAVTLMWLIPDRRIERSLAS